MFWKKKKTTTSEPVSFAMRKNIGKLLGAKGIPPAPALAERAFELSLKNDIEARDFIDLIEADEGLSARILKIANSAYFGRKERCESIADAVVVIGSEELGNFLSANALRGLFPSRHGLRSKLWRHDIAVGLAARILAEETGNQRSSLAFMGGLMHDIGKLLLLQRFEKELEKTYTKVKEEEIPYLQAEEDVFLSNHTEVGYLIAEKWNFSEELSHIIRFHHAPWESKELQAQPLTRLVKAGNCLVHSLALIDFPIGNVFQEQALDDVPLCLKALGISENKRSELLDRISRTFQNEEELYL